MSQDFVFIDGWTLYCSNGLHMKILKKDLKEARKKGMTEDQIKSVSFTYLTTLQTKNDVSYTEDINQKYEF